MDGEERPTAARHFGTTRWSLVAEAAEPGTDRSRAALEELCRAYWDPLYAYLRRRGESAHDAQDLVQGFFAAMLQKDWLSKVDRERGRFRSWLLASLRHFASNERAKARARKRGGDRLRLSLDFEAGENRYQVEPATGATPEALYEKRFALTLLDRALERLAHRYRSHSPERGERYEALRPYLLEEGERSYRETGEALGLTETAVKVAVHRLRTLFREALRREVAETLVDPADVDAEIRHLATALRGGRANGGRPNRVE